MPDIKYEIVKKIGALSKAGSDLANELTAQYAFPDLWESLYGSD